MTLTQKKIFIIVGIVAGLVLAGLLYITVIRDRDVDNEAGSTSTPSRTATPSGTSLPPNTVTPPPSARPTLPPGDQYLIQLARIFVERMGSYSSQDENAHITDILPLATARMSKYLETKMKPQSSTYTGQTTRVITSRLEEKQDAKAVVILDTQQEVNDGKTTRREYRAARVELARVSATEWKVDGVYWQ